MGNGNDLQSDSVAEINVLNEIQNSLREMAGNLDLEQLGLSKVPSDFSFVAFDEILKPKDRDECQSLKSNINKFNEDQAHAFNLILNESLLGFQLLIFWPQ